MIRFALPADSPLLSTVVRLEGRDFRIELDYLGKADRFAVSVFDAVTNVPIIRGQKALVGSSIAVDTANALRLREGVLTFSGPTDGRPRLRDLGRSVSLVYATFAEIEASP
jgi:hypothetical protein